MARGPKHHMKRIATPKRWCLDKLGGIYAPRPSPGPHKLRECLPMALVLRNKLKYALNYNEVKLIAVQKLIKVDQRPRTDRTFPIGFMDVVTIDKTKENFRMLYNPKGTFCLKRITPEEATYKLCRVRKIARGSGGIPYAYMHDGRTVRYAHPAIRVKDTVKLDLATGRPVDHVKFGIGAIAMVTGGHSIGRVGKITGYKHDVNVDAVTLKDARGEEFTTISSNVFVIGTDKKVLVSLPRDKGIRKSILELQAERFGEHKKI